MDIKTLTKIEYELEEEAVEQAMRRYREAVDRAALEESPVGLQLIRQNLEAVIAGIKLWIAESDAGVAGRARSKNVNGVKFIRQFSFEEVAFMALRATVRACHTPNSRLTASAMKLVAEMESVDLVGRLKKSNRQVYLRYLRFADKLKTRPHTERLAILRDQFKYTGEVSNRAALFSWDDGDRAQLGCELFRIVADCTGLISIEDVRVSDVGKQRQALCVLPTVGAAEWIEHAHTIMGMDRPAFYPMVVPPNDWKGNTGGGYLKATNGFTKRLLKSSVGGNHPGLITADLARVCEAINAIQRTPWQVNREVLATLDALLERDVVTAGLPGSPDALESPPRMDFMDREKETWSPAEEELFKGWKKERGQYERAKATLLSRREAVSHTTRIARRMVEFERIYFPHTLDFRGRAYPLPSGLQPQGSDLQKGLLRFADAVPLGQHGMRWLAIHGANSYGVDKVSFEDRVRWVKENFESICLDAEDPLRKGAIWVVADSPFVFLSFCFEWAALAGHIADGHPAETFLSRIPVGIDGSCNGLQHFSAMLRDEIGGRATNLIRAADGKPSDIYSLVAAEVSELVEMDLADDEKKEYAAFWLGKGITRKWAKRNTMTLPYGVSKFGMKDQLWAEIGGDEAANFFGPGKIDRGMTIRYLADKNWTAIGKVVVAARSVMDWLHEAAKSLTEAGQPVRWTTLDGLPLQQRYCGTESVRVQIFGRTAMIHLKRLMDERLDGRRQASGLSPNFVHSVDATHMRMVVRRLAAEGVCGFAMIHDSFGTHAGHVERLAEVTREEFVILHETDVLASFRQEIRALLPTGKELKALPNHGTLDLAAVQFADYFFA